MPGLGNWWRNRALKRERSRVDPELWPKLHAALPLLEGLSAREVQSLDDLALLFARDKNFELPQMLHSEYSAVYAQLRAWNFSPGSAEPASSPFCGSAPVSSICAVTWSPVSSLLPSVILFSSSSMVSL